jgi:hypothetical protein
MPLQIHDIEVADGSTFQNQDRLVIAQQFNVANPVGAAGSTVTVSITFGVDSLPATGYAVLVEPNQNCFSWVINKTVNGFNVLLSPSVPATGTVAAGTFDVVVFG